MAGLMWLLMAASLSALGLAAQLDLDCAKPESARALIDYAQLSEICHAMIRKIEVPSLS